MYGQLVQSILTLKEHVSIRESVPSECSAGQTYKRAVAWAHHISILFLSRTFTYSRYPHRMTALETGQYTISAVQFVSPEDPPLLSPLGLGTDADSGATVVVLPEGSQAPRVSRV